MQFKILIGYIAIVLFVGFLISLNEPDPKKSACLGIELEMTKASQCVAYPDMWEEWDEISRAYGGDSEKSVGTVGCPFFMDKMAEYGFFSDKELVLIFKQLVINNDVTGGVAYKFDKIAGENLCDVAEKNGWIEIYLQNRRLK